MLSKLKENYKKIIDYMLDDSIDITKKDFYLVVVWGVFIYTLLAVVFLVTHAHAVYVGYCFVCAVFVFGLGYAAHINGMHKEFSLLFSIVLNFLANPMIFLFSGNNYGGCIIFFLLGIVLSVYLNNNIIQSLILMVSELAFYSVIIVFAYKNQMLFHSDKYNNISMLISLIFILAAIAIIFMFVYQTYFYNQARKRMNKANAEISLAESTKVRFLANMTHEIRTPMNAIVGMTDLILKEELTTTAREQINTVKQASEQLLAIINDILEYSKIDSNRIELMNVEYSFKNVIHDIITNVSNNYTKENITFHVFINKDIPDRVFGDDIRIVQIFKYILFSSLSQSKHGSVYLDINSEIDELESTVKFVCKVASTGNGFSTSEIEAIFNAYSSYDSRQRNVYKGMGLELSICRALLKMMNGDLSIESIEGIGTAVTFTFTNYMLSDKPIASIENEKACKPLIFIDDRNLEQSWQRLMENFKISAAYARGITTFKTALENTRFTQIFVPGSSYEVLKDVLVSYECEDITYVITDFMHSYGDFGNCKILRTPVYSINLTEAIDGSWNAENYKKLNDQEIITYPNARVLVVDDSSVNLRVMESLLSTYLIKPVMAESGMEALDILRRERFDLILLDQIMPVMDGIETVTQILQSDFESKDVPIICVTADFGPDIRERLLNVGFTDYLSKPVNLTFLDKVLRDNLPKDLVVFTKNPNAQVADSNESNVDKVEDDPYEFNASIGIQNLGGNKEAYITVLQSYYTEGLEKLETVPEQFLAGDISLYTTNVHALKSSSATVGAMGISPLFKALEFAGKDNNIDFIQENSQKTFEKFVKVLDIVREYLISEDALPEEDDGFEISEDAAIEAINKELLSELKTTISTMNLRRTDEIIDELSSHNYGSDINGKVKEIRNNYNNFEYTTVIEIINDILS